MEVMCMTCGTMFSVDDNKYGGEWENFCSIDCHTKWMVDHHDPSFTLKEGAGITVTITPSEDGEIKVEQNPDSGV